jgi:hypothetical protein
VRIYILVTLNVPCPPNYGRYFDTAVVSTDPSVAVDASVFNNCVFELLCDGFDAIVAVQPKPLHI